MVKLFKGIGVLAVLVLVLALAAWALIARPEFGSAAVDPALDADPAMLEQHVRALSVDFAPRDYRNPGNLNAAADYIAEAFEAAGLSVREQKYSVGGAEYRNIIASLGPRTGPKLVIGAHYDGAGTTPGADDNASGVAGLIELARLLGDSPPSMPFELVAYTLEEPPFFATEHMGSFVHAKAEAEAGAEIELMISLEMIGFFSDVKGSQSFPIDAMQLIYPDTGNFIAIVDRLMSGRAHSLKSAMKRHMSLPVHSINAPASIPGIDFSDHRSYWAHGYDAVMVTDTAFYRNRAYHTSQDTADTLDYDAMTQVVQGVFGAVQEFGGQ